MHVCLFDIDGTLLASGGAGKAALETSLCEEFRVELRFDVPYSGRTDRAIFRDLLHHHGIAETPANLQKLVDGYLSRLPNCLQRKKGRVLPGMANLLTLLRERNHVAVGLLTGNIRAGAKTKLSHYGIYQHFAFGGFGDDHFDRDDVAREALAAARQHVHPDLTPDRIWVIGDTPLDVRCARAIGAKVVAVATGMHPLDELQAAEPELALKDMLDPEPFLRLWQ